ncbi:MAG: hypothetical protein HFJ29_03110 [Clostridia bacterium]|nr:hypothetical protein [Clostridia bacterium]MCI9038853.1 hypothetical protein [Clostridia bacterium]
MNIIEIYNKYHLPENLQMHMLRVASCSNLIMDNWNETIINREAIIRASLLHDMGNMAKISDNEIEDEKFRKIRKEYIDKYGRDSHKINLVIATEEGLKDYEVDIIDRKSSKRSEETLNSERYDVKILLYADQRVAPYGVTSLRERLEEVKKRYKNIVSSVWSNEEKANHLIDCSLGIEKQIMEHCSISPEAINDESIKKYMEKLKEYNI